MVRTYLDLSINERINLKSWYVSLPLAYHFKNGTLKKDVNEMFSDFYVGGGRQRKQKWRVLSLEPCIGT